MIGFIYQPQPVLRIVGAHAHTVGAWSIGAFEQVIPLIPYLQDFTFAVGYVDDVLPDPAAALQHIPAQRRWEAAITLWDRIGQTSFTSLDEKDAPLVLHIDAGGATESHTFLSESLHPALGCVVIGAGAEDVGVLR